MDFGVLGRAIGRWRDMVIGSVVMPVGGVDLLGAAAHAALFALAGVLVVVGALMGPETRQVARKSAELDAHFLAPAFSPRPA